MMDEDDRDMEIGAAPMPSESELRASMDRSDADADAGRTVPLDNVVATLRVRAGSVRAARARPARSA